MADYRGLNIRWQADSTDATKALHLIGQEAKVVQANLNAVETALKNTATNGTALNAALKSLQLDNIGRAAKLAGDKTSAYSQVLAELSKRLQEQQEKLVRNRDVLESMPEKYDGLAASAKASYEKVAQAQAILDEASKRVEFAGSQQSWVQAVNDQAQAQAQLNAAIAAGDDEFKKLYATYGTLEGAVNSAEESIRSIGESMERTQREMLAEESRAKALAEQHRILDAAQKASYTSLYQWGEGAVKVGDGMRSFGDSISAVGDKLTIVSGVVLATLGRKMVTATEEFGNAVSQLGGYLEIGGSQLEHMSDLALKWGKDTQFSATEAANAMNELAKGGMTQAQIEGGAMEATMQLAAAGGLDMASAASVAVQAIKTFGLEAADASKVADALAGAANQSTAEVTELANGFKYVGGWATMAGWNINEVSGALALLSDHGLQSEMAGTALRNVMQRLAAPTDKAAEIMASYGFSVRDANGQMVSATEMVRRLGETFGSLADEEKQNVLNEIFGARALPAAIALMEEGADKLQGYIDATDRAGYASEMAKNRMGDLGWALEYLRGEAETATVNFGQALAPTIIDVANKIEGLASWFNGLSSSTQEAIAKGALFVLGAGPVLSIVGHLASGIGGLISTVGTGAQTISAFAKLMGSSATATEGATSVIHNLASAYASVTVPAGEVVAKTAAIEGALASFGTGVAVTGAIAVIGMLVSNLMDYVSAEGEFRDATQGLHDSLESIGATATTTTDAMDGAARSWESVRDASRELNKEQAELSNTISSSFGDVSKNATLLDEYADTIESLSNKSKLTSGEQERLVNAVKGVNDIAGTNITVIDAQSGRIDAQVRSIREAISSYKEYAQVQASMSAYTKVQEQIIENDMEIARLRNEIANADKGTGWYIGDFAVFSDFFGVADKYHELEKSLSQANERSKELSYAQTYLNDKMDDASVSSEEYKKKLDSLGLSTKEAADLTRDSADNAAGSVEDASERAKRAIEDALTAAKRANEDAYTSAKREWDDAYSNLKATLDAAYSARKTELDREADAYSDALKREVDIAKKAYDEELSEFKSLHKKEEEELKDSQSRETEIFKDETKKRIAEIKKEYEARKQAIADSDGTKQIDERIKQLKGETEAENRAAKEKERGEKESELRMAVERAKTVRARQDAEKSLSDYLAKVAQERREQSRTDEISRLQEEKSAIAERTKQKQNQLDEERDAEIQRYEDDRKIALDALSRRHADELALMEEQHKAAQEQMAEWQEQDIANRRAANELLVQDRKDANAAELSEIKAANEQRLLEQKRAAEDALSQMKRDQEDALTSLKRSLEDGAAAVSNASATVLGDATSTSDGLSTISTSLYRKLTRDEREFHGSILNDEKANNAAIAEEQRKHADESDRNAGDLRARVREQFANLNGEVAPLGSKMLNEYATGISTGGDNALANAQSVMGSISSTMSDPASQAVSWGWDMLVNFNNGFMDAWNRGGVAGAFDYVGQQIANIFKHSKPKEGPLKDDDVWFYHMGQNLASGLERSAPLIESQVNSIADMIDAGLDADRLKMSGTKYVDAYRNVLGNVELLASAHDRSMGAYVNGYSASINVDTQSAARAVTDAITSAVGGLRAQTIPPVVVERMYVRDDSDVRRVSRELHRLQMQETRRALA